jgi:hypothetical protein
MITILIGVGYWGNIIKEKLKSQTDLLCVANSKDNIDDILSNKCDTLFICTPTKTHYELVKKSILSNIANIFCEKPFTGDYKKAQELFILAEKYNKNLFIDNVFLYRTEILEIEQKKYKNIKFLWKKHEVIYKDNLINNFLYHDIYLLIHITGTHEWFLKKKNITEDYLYIELYNNDNQNVIFDYNRNFSLNKIKQIYLDDIIINLSNPKNDPLYEIIENIKNKKINFTENKKIVLQTLHTINNLNL